METIVSRTLQKHAREIMDHNMFGIEEAIRYFGVNPSKEQLAALAEVPFSQEVLQSCQDTHVLVAVFPLSILDIRGKVERQLFYGHEDAWYNKEKFAKDRGEIGWQLVRKTPVENSTSKTWNDQQVLLGETEETPPARTMVYTIIGHYLATNERLFQNIYVRTSSLDSDGSCVAVGVFVGAGLGIGYCWDDRRRGLGLAASLKFQTEN